MGPQARNFVSLGWLFAVGSTLLGLLALVGFVGALSPASLNATALQLPGVDPHVLELQHRMQAEMLAMQAPWRPVQAVLLPISIACHAWLAVSGWRATRFRAGSERGLRAALIATLVMAVVLSVPSMAIAIQAADVMAAFLDGLAGDTSTYVAGLRMSASSSLTFGIGSAVAALGLRVFLTVYAFRLLRDPQVQAEYARAR